MTVESETDLNQLRRIGRIVAETLHVMQLATRPGMHTRDIDAVGEAFLKKHGARSAPQLVYNFPAATCISVNEEVAHGIPGDRRVEPGDMVNIDVSAELDGYFADTGGSFIVPPSSPLKQRLCHATQMALQAAMVAARAGRPINAIGKAIERTAKEKGFKIVRNLTSHGVGRNLHEYPDHITSYFDPRDERHLHEGMVITIEPFLSTKATWVEDAGDGWTLIAPKGNLAAQYEHTMVITRGKPEIITVLH